MGWYWLDPVMGIVGAVIISKWAWGLIQHTSPLLLDDNQAVALQTKVSAFLQLNDKHVVDIHLMRVNSSDFILVAIIVTHDDVDCLALKKLVTDKFSQIKHVTLEIHLCDLPDCGQAASFNP